MSSIEKLSLLGIRSFDNTRSETIQFHAPLTLIVGLNGSGKTTIIEALKYITTGEVPPGTGRGAPWIHDPKLCGEKEVMAQIKASFHSTQGNRLVATRSMTLTVKKATRTFKGLEGNLLMMRDGERITMSSRSMEMAAMVPEYLGVSKSILSNVIFCHQEDSLWPLGEASKLKQKFDDIFEAVKYTQAIDNIKVLQKQNSTKLIEARKDKEHTKVIKDKGEKVKRQTEKLYDEIEVLRGEADEKKASIKEVQQKMEAAWTKANTAGEIVGELIGKRIEQKNKEESVQSLKESLEEMSESDDELQRLIDHFDEQVQQDEDSLDKKKKLYIDLNQQIQTARNGVSSKERECGSYEAQQQNHDRQLQNREKLVKETARSHGIRGFDIDIDDSQVKAFTDRIGKMAREQDATVERHKEETKEALQHEQQNLNKLSEQKTSLNQKKESARQAMAKNDNKISSLQSDLNKIDIDEGSKVTWESNLRETKAKLDTAKSDQTSADWDYQIEKAEAELRNLEDQHEKLNAELVEGTRQASDSARIDFVRKEYKAKQSSLETMTGAHGEKITSIVGEGWTPPTLETRYQQALNHHSTQVSDAEKQRDGTSREMEQVDYKLKDCRNDIQAKTKAVKKAENAIRDAIGGEPSTYHEVIKELEDNRDYYKNDAESLSRVMAYFDSCIKFADGGCRTCARPFKNDSEREKMITLVKKEKEKLESIGNVKKDLEETERDLQAARGVSSDFDEWERLKNKDIPKLEKAKTELEETRQRLVSKLEDQDSVVSERLSAKRDAESMNKTIQKIIKDSADASNYEAQIKDLVEKQKSDGSSRGLDLIHQDTKKVNDEAKSVKSRLSKITGERDRASKHINSLELEYRDIQSKLTNAEYQLKEKKSLGGQIDDAKNTNSEYRESIKSYDSELSGLGPQFNQTQAKYDDISRRATDKERELQAEATKLNNSKNQLKMADDEIKAYVDKGGPEQLERGRREVERLKGEVTRLEKEQGGLVREVKELENKLRSHSDTRRSISDNQRYRRDYRALQTVKAEISELETHNAEEDQARHQSEGQKWQNEFNKLSAEEATLVGTLRAKDQELQAKYSEYETEYKNAPFKFKEAQVKAGLLEACVKDLGQYSAALDKAIMKYHSIKMEEINRIIDELWRKTYQGTDVDTIMIRSEHENSKANKSYNYRVCMVKQDAEMDMRGRCSAGQKVLACIIIRLALAECFGTNCGLIALDEPTTNLDRDNIRALAESLGEIIKMRRAQKNFQLIVITHDEEFLRYMGCSDFADVYYRVSRNERQKSVIERQSIAEVV